MRNVCRRVLKTVLDGAGPLALGLSVVSGCAGGPPARAPGAIPLKAKAPPVTPWTWSVASDLERIDHLFLLGRDLWGASQVGLVHWDRTTGQVALEGGTDAPGADVTVLAAAADGTIYAGLPAGLAWRQPDGTWKRTSAGPLSGGVTALAPRAEGGVWIGLAGGLAHFADGRLHLVNERHHIRAFSVAGDGTVWAATDAYGVLRLGPTLQEFTSGQGVCGSEIRSVFAGPAGQVGVTCLEAGNRARFSLGRDGRFVTYELKGVANPVERVEPLGDRLIVRTVGADFRLEPEAVAPLPPHGAEGKAPVVAAVVPEAVVAIDRVVAEPSPPVVATPPAPPSAADAPAPASSAVPPSAPASAGVADELGRLAHHETPPPKGNAKLPAPVPMPPPIAPTAPPPVDDMPLPVERASAAGPGGATPIPRFRVSPWPPGTPADATVTATLPLADGTTFYALAWRGVLSVKDAERQRFTTHTLGTLGDFSPLAVDGLGHAVLTDAQNRVLRWQAGGWNPRVVDTDREVIVRAATFDESNQLWVVAQKAGEPGLRIYKAGDGQDFALLGKPTLPKLEGPAQVGSAVVDTHGAVVFPLFWRDKKGGIRAAGLGRVPPTMDRVELMGPDDGSDAQPPGELRLPDAWISAVVRARTGEAIYLGTNSGLVRLQAGSLRTFNENDNLQSEVILAVAVDTHDRVWAGTTEGLGYIEGDTWHAVDGPFGTERIEALGADGDRLWVGTESALYVGENNHFAKVTGTNGGFDVTGPVRTAQSDGQGGLWVLTPQGVLHATPVVKR